MRFDVPAASRLYQQRQTAIAARRASLKNMAKDLPSMLSMEDSLGVSVEELTRLIEQRDEGKAVAGRLSQLSIP
ncbi:hypothetical protein LLE87_35900, partial [Paenibacillus polymyxa]|nr:hypothetical protein [Paenibacillus polymyxa]